MTTIVDFVMPSLGADMDEGTITEWLVGVGDRVERGDVVAVVETDKADIDVEVWQSGRVAELLVAPGRLVPVGTALARLEVADGAIADGAMADGATALAPSDPPSSLSSPSEPLDGQDAPGQPEAAPSAGAEPAPRSEPAAREHRPARPRPSVVSGSGPSRVAASPRARRLAAERGIDLAAVAGTGPGGAVVADDLSQEPTPRSRRPRGRRAVAELMARSKREIPHYYLATQIDMEAALTELEHRNRDRPIEDRVLPAALLLRATASSLADNPELNGFWIDDDFVPGDGVHLGVAISLRGGGLVAPIIGHADRLTLDDLMVALREVVARARTGRVRASEMTGATATVTNLGERGVEVVHGVIHPPQVALVGFGRIAPGPAVVDGAVVARRQVTATLAGDHRASDGQRGARLLNAIDRTLQNTEVPV